MDINRRGFLKGIIGLAAGIIIAPKLEQNIKETEELEIKEYKSEAQRTYVEMYVSNGGRYITIPRLKDMTTNEKTDIWLGVDINGKQILAIPAIFTDQNGGYNLGIPVSGDARAYLV